MPAIEWKWCSKPQQWVGDKSHPRSSAILQVWTYDMIAVIQSSDLNETIWNLFIFWTLYTKLMTISGHHLLRKNLFFSGQRYKLHQPAGVLPEPLQTRSYLWTQRIPGGPVLESWSVSDGFRMISGSWLFHFFPKVSDFFEGSWKERKETWWFESVRDIDVGCHNMEPNVIEVLVH